MYRIQANAAVIASGQWAHFLLIDDSALPLDSPVSIQDDGDYLDSVFSLSADQAQQIAGAASVGHSMQGGRDAPEQLGYRIDIDAEAAPRVRGFMNYCAASRAGLRLGGKAAPVASPYLG